MNVIMSGYGYSGSSAFNDLILEVEGYKEFGDELRFVADPGGLLDFAAVMRNNPNPFSLNEAYLRLEQIFYFTAKKYTIPYLGFSHNDNARKDFLALAEKYLDSLVVNEYDGIWHGNNNVLNRMQVKLEHKGIKFKKNYTKKMYTLVSYDQFVSKTRSFLNEIISSDKMIIDEGFCSLNPDTSLELFGDNTRLIISSRDPRSTYADVIRKNVKFIPQDAEGYIAWYNDIRSRHDNSVNRSLSGRFLHIPFEQIVLDYENVKDRVFKLLEIDPAKHIAPKTKLDPSVSIKNIRCWENNKDKSFQDSIKKIEEGCADYLYDKA